MKQYLKFLSLTLVLLTIFTSLFAVSASAVSYAPDNAQHALDLNLNTKVTSTSVTITIPDDGYNYTASIH